jgi:branched-chain amino acid transport system substrate-binding protein
MYYLRFLNHVSILIILILFCTAQNTVCATGNQSFTCGVILPLSGDLNISGTYLLQGIQLAADEINMRGGMAGHQVHLCITDDQGDPEKALSLFQKMQTDGIPVVIGSYTTDTTLLMAEETKNTKDIMLISPRANGKDLYGISPRFYQVHAPFYAVAQFVSDWLSHTAVRVSIIYVDDEYGKSVKEEIRSNLEKRSVLITGIEPVSMEEMDYSVLVRRILDGAPDSMVIIVYDSVQIPIIRNLYESGFRGQIMLTESGFISSFKDTIPDLPSKFSLFTVTSNTNLVPGDHTNRFVSSYKERFGQNPEKTIAGYGYDSMMVIADAIRLGYENGNISTRMILNGLNGTRYYGVTGPKVFDSHQAAIPALDHWIFKDGDFVLLTTTLR